MYRSVFHRRWQVILYLDHVRRRWNFHLHGCGGELLLLMMMMMMMMMLLLLLLLLVVQCRKLAQGGLRRALLKRTIRFDICLSVYPTQRVWQHESIALFARTQTCGAIPRIVRIDQNRAYTFIYTIYIYVFDVWQTFGQISDGMLYLALSMLCICMEYLGILPLPGFQSAPKFLGSGIPGSQLPTFLLVAFLAFFRAVRIPIASFLFFWLRRQVDPFEKP